MPRVIWSPTDSTKNTTERSQLCHTAPSENRRVQLSSPTQVKEIPIEAFLKKLVGIRDRLRVLEQKINSHPSLAAEEKLELQGYITRCYGSLTTFNVLFGHRASGFVGQGDREG